VPGEREVEPRLTDLETSLVTIPVPEQSEVAPSIGQEMQAVLIIGAAVNEEVMDLLKRVDPMPQVQTYRFHWAAIHAIEKAGGSLVDIISTVPTFDYPVTRKVLWGLRRVQSREAEGRQFVIMPFVNLLGLKQVTRFVSCFWFTLSWLWSHRRHPRKVLLLYGLIVSHLYVALILGKLFGTKVVTIVTDPPTPRRTDENAIYAAARSVDRWLLLWGLKRIDGLIALAEGTSRLVARGVPAIVVEGMISDEVEQFCRSLGPAENRGESVGRFVIMYAGQMDERLYGVEILLDAFKQLEDPSFALWLFGRGRLVEEVRRAAEGDSRIVYWGFHEADVVLSHMQEASVLVNSRPVDEAYGRFSFPSKVLEYLAMGKIVLSSRLPGIPVDYHPHLVFVDEMTPSNLATRLREIAGWSLEKRREAGNQARDFTWRNKTQLHQGERICRFLRDVVEG